jgi:competence protein ComEC
VNHDPLLGGDALDALDVRLVPAALTCWLVTAAGILGALGPILAAGFVLMAAVVLAVRLWGLESWARLSAGLLAICMVGACFGLAITLRANHIRSHPVASRFGTVTEVTLTPTESPRALGSGRLMFKAELNLIGQDRTHGRVTAFASGVAFAESAAGRPMRFRARIGAPRRRDLTVATLTATGEPVMGSMSALQRAADTVRRGFGAAARAALPADEAAMLPALVLGDTSALAGATSVQFRATGLTHLKVSLTHGTEYRVSGRHLHPYQRRCERRRAGRATPGGRRPEALRRSRLDRRRGVLRQRPIGLQPT